MSSQKKYSISAFWRIWIPLSFFIGLAVFHHIDPIAYVEYIGGELGALENLQPLILLGALCCAVPMFFQLRHTDDALLKYWVGLAAVCCLYVFLEEISYGQHYFGWEADGIWQEINDQQETNLHNTSSWLDQKPRNLLMVGIIVGGLIMPLLQKYKPGFLPAKYQRFYPSAGLWCVALLGIAAHFLDDIFKKTPAFFDRSSEIEEAFYYYFTFLYLAMLKKDVVSGIIKNRATA